MNNESLARTITKAGNLQVSQPFVVRSFFFSRYFRTAFNFSVKVDKSSLKEILSPFVGPLLAPRWRKCPLVPFID
jgi:hypothetical protein